MKKIWKICFSPVGTTKEVCSSLADSLARELGLEPESYDFTLPQARRSFPSLSENDLAVFAVPTYAGRVPNVLLQYLRTVSGGGASAVAVVTFGNRNFDSSLLELADILTAGGFKVKAAAAMSCQHSFSDTLGKGRPDQEDMAQLDAFAGRLSKVLLNSAAPGKRLQIPGIEGTYGGYYKPRDRYGNHIDIRKVTPKVSKSCTDCGLCASVCPMGSISPDDVRKMTGICIKCNACLKKCPSGVRYFDDPGYIYHKEELEAMYSRRAENSFFL